MKIALLTCKNLDGFVVDDPLLSAALESKGIHFEFLPWDESVNWSQFDLAVIRTTWDYTKRLSEFLAALGHIESQCLLLNPLSVVRWNSNKTYLLELQKRGIAIVPTLEVSSSLGFPLDWKRVLFKPQVGANSDNISIVDRDHIPLGLRNLDPAQGWLVQPFLEEIHEGEISFHFFDGEFSHAVLKVPKAGDFRVQEEHGGTILPYQPTLLEVAAAARVLEATAERLLYARVDMVKSGGDLLLMELELIEPSLYFRTDSASAGFFADTLVDFIK